MQIGIDVDEMLPPQKLTVRTRKWMVGRLLFFWDTIFSGAMLVSGRVVLFHMFNHFCDVA